MQKILAWVTALVAVIAGAFTLGRSKAAAEAQQKHTEERAAADVAAAQTVTKKIQETARAQQTINRLPDDDVDRQLRDKWQRP